MESISTSKAPIQSIISALPRENGWLSSNDIYLCQYQGFWYYPSVLEKMLIGLKPVLSPSDILLCSAPKSGTTWLKALAFAVTTRNRYHHTKDSPLLTTLPHQLIPFIEFSPLGNHSVHDSDPDLPLFSTHLPYTSLPKSILACDCKIIYICRDPKDAFISRWHFAHNSRPNKNSTEPIPLDEAFGLFCRGVSSFGPYWDHVQGYWKASLDYPDKILFIKYEDMMNDPISYLVRLAKFMGYPFSYEEVMDGVPVKIVQMCSFESLSNFEVNKEMAKASFVVRDVLTNGIYFRKGKVGDWKNYLTQEMSNKIDQITMKKLSPLGLCYEVE